MTRGHAPVNGVSDANVCPCCLLPHKEEECRFKNAFCFRCKETGHLKRACRNPKPNKGNGGKPTTKVKEGQHTQKRQQAGDCGRRRRSVNAVVEEESGSESGDNYQEQLGIIEECSATNEADCDNLQSLEARRKPWLVDVRIEGQPIKMELDTGAAVSVMSGTDFKKYFGSSITLHNCSLRLRTYTGEVIKPLGMATMLVEHNKQEKRLPLYVLPSEGPPLLGSGCKKSSWNGPFSVCKCKETYQPF